MRSPRDFFKPLGSVPPSRPRITVKPSAASISRPSNQDGAKLRRSRRDDSCPATSRPDSADKKIEERNPREYRA